MTRTPKQKSKATPSQLSNKALAFRTARLSRNNRKRVKSWYKEILMLKLYLEGLSTKVLEDIKISDFNPSLKMISVSHHRRTLLVQLSSQTCKMIIQFISEYRADGVLYGSKRTNFIFRNRHGGKENRGTIFKALKTLINVIHQNPSFASDFIQPEELEGGVLRQGRGRMKTRYFADLKSIYLCAHPKA
jgi:site-specific recombinase XerD